MSRAMAVRTSLLLAIAAALSIAWAAATGVVAVRHWPAVAAAMAQDRDTGVRGCAGRYPEPAARDRCAALFETQFVMERNVAVFTRLLIGLAPLAATGAWLAVARRHGRGAGR